MKRRGFTVLETIMAAALGAIILAACLSIMAAIRRTDATLEARAAEQSELNKLRTVMQRVFTSLLVSNAPATARDSTTRGVPISRDVPIVKVDVTGADVPPGRHAVVVPPRIVLAPDPALAGAVMQRAATADIATGTPTPVQSLEVVLSDPPILTGYAEFDQAEAARRRQAALLARQRGEELMQATRDRGAKQDAGKGTAPKDSADAGDKAGAKPGRKDATRRTGNTGDDPGTPPPAGGSSPVMPDDQQDEIAAGVKAVRGILQLRPQRDRDGQPAPLNPENPLWELWWVPMSARETGVQEQPEQPSIPAGEPIVVASRLRYLRWVMFDNSEKKVAMQVARQRDLPAYVEVEVETESGLYANWMFEVVWASGPEVLPRPNDTDPRSQENNRNNGRAGAQDGSGQAPLTAQPAQTGGGAK